MYILRNILVDYRLKPDLKKLCSNKIKIDQDQIIDLKLLKRSLDARQKNNLKFNYTVLVDTGDVKLTHADLQTYNPPQPYLKAKIKLADPHPFIIGSGPAGLFCALSLVKKGFKPWIFDRGEKLETRITKVNDFWKKGNLDPECNAQFGEGGAGTFSDGKLTSRSQDYYTEKVFDILVEMGADPAIKTDSLPHLGSDVIRKIILKMRKFLEKEGCRFFWQHRLNDLKIKNQKLSEIKINDQTFHPEILILAPGNAARDTFSTLKDKIKIENKPFAVGFRIEHKQDFINTLFYGEKTDLDITGPATYRLVTQINNKGVYSFCMCPGGQVISTATEPDHIATNGMSMSKRNGSFANSAIVCSINKSELGNLPCAGIKLQKQIESKCFNSNRSYYAPVQKGSDFICDRISSRLPANSYLPSTFRANLNSIFPKTLSIPLKKALVFFEKRYPGFTQNGILIAPETRTSSPVRIIRDRNRFNSLSVVNLFPIGEGSGYAGGIISSAADGVKLGSILTID